MFVKRLSLICLTVTLAVLTIMGALAFLGSKPVHASPDVRYVAPGGDCGGATPCYASIQAAVDAASPGDVIKVAQGTYTDIYPRADITQVVYIDKTVTIQGGYTTTDWMNPDPAAHPTVLDAQGQGRVLVITDTTYVTVEGLGITGGNAERQGGGLWGNDAGGGVYMYYAMSVTIAGCDIYSNSAKTVEFCCGDGGGLYLRSSDYAMLEGNTIRDNVGNRAGHGNGGGLYLDRSHHITLRNNVIHGNMATTANGVGGGLYLTDCDYATLEGNVVSDNTTSVGADAYGGGMYLANAHHAILINNTIRGNIASKPTWGYGGGLYLYGGNDVILSGNIVVSNTAASNPAASGWGGGLYLIWSNATLINTVVIENQANTEGSGVHVQASAPHLLHTTIAHNGGGSGVYVAEPPWDEYYSNVTLTNTILVGHGVGISVTTGSTATLDATLWNANSSGNWGGTGTIHHTNDYTGDPAFAFDGYHLTARSAAIDRGVNAGVPTDIDGDPRPIGPAPDIGADEYMARIYLPLAMKNHP